MHHAILPLFFVILLLFDIIAIHFQKKILNNQNTSSFSNYFDLFVAYNANDPNTIWKLFIPHEYNGDHFLSDFLSLLFHNFYHNRIILHYFHNFHLMNEIRIMLIAWFLCQYAMRASGCDMRKCLRVDANWLWRPTMARHHVGVGSPLTVAHEVATWLTWCCEDLARHSHVCGVSAVTVTFLRVANSPLQWLYSKHYALIPRQIGWLGHCGQ